MATGEEPRILLLGLGVPCYNMYRRLRGSGYINFAGIDFSGRDLRQANLSSTGLAEACLRGADLRHASLWCANASGADFTDADLRNADMFRVNCTSALFLGARLDDANLTAANFEGAKGMRREDFERWISLTQAFVGKQAWNFHARFLLQEWSFEEVVEKMRSSIIFDDSA